MSAPPHADPGLGVFETMLVIAGRAVELDAHLERLRASLAELYGAELPGAARAAVAERAEGIAHGRLRLTVRPERAGLALDVTAREIDPLSVFPGPERAVALRSTVVTGGLGEHKWADRRLLDRAAAEAPGELPLLLDSDGSVLEASRGSVFAVRSGRLATPPTDGRILLSIARRQAIEAAAAAGVRADEERLARADLLAADEVFLAGSVRGIEPVRALDGAVLPRPGPISARVAKGLRRRWLGAEAGAPVAAGATARPGDRPGR